MAQYVFPADFALQQYPALYLDAETVERVLHGNAFRYEQHATMQPEAELARIYDSSGHFLAIAIWNRELQMWQPKKVLA